MDKDLCYRCIHRDDGYCLIDKSYDGGTPIYTLNNSVLVQCEKYEECWVSKLKSKGTGPILIKSMVRLADKRLAYSVYKLHDKGSI